MNMIRRIIEIDRDACTGCGICVEACHEGAIGLENGKAILLRDDYCDGLGDCLPACPAGAISFTEREAAAYDHAAVLAKKQEHPLPCGCPGTEARSIPRQSCDCYAAQTESRLSQWPVQIKLAPIQASYFQGASLLIAASCTAYAYASFHEDFIVGRITLIGCPKLDGVDYSEKLSQILKGNDIRDILLVRMEVPCCGGLEKAVERALDSSGKEIPFRTLTITTDGKMK